jgi:site-specific DNA-methyltransferase (cytosine-N4-specific)
VIRKSFDRLHAGGAIPANVIETELLEDLTPDTMLKFGNNAANDAYAKRSKELGLKMHPARFPAALPEFFIKLLTNQGDTVLDPFARSNTTGVVAESQRRNWVAMEEIPEYLEASKIRFTCSESETKKANTQLSLLSI